MLSILLHALILLPPLFLAVLLHEVAHGYVAERLGDPTARRLGRITLNPLPHIDPVLTLLMPATLLLLGSPFVFGGAKPVPVNPLHFRNPRRGMAYVALAGPVTNFLLATVLWVVLLGLRLLPISETSGFPPAALAALGLLVLWVEHGVLINIVLGTFNLLPIPPLDGGRIAVGFLPIDLARRWAKLERWGLLIVIILLSSGTVARILDPIIRFFAIRVLP